MTMARDRWQRRFSVDPVTLWSAVAEHGQHGGVVGPGLLLQGLQQLAQLVMQLQATAKVEAERHTAEIASLREQLDLCHCEASIRMQTLQEEVQLLRAEMRQVGPPSTELDAEQCGDDEKGQIATRSEPDTGDPCGFHVGVGFLTQMTGRNGI